MLFASRGRRLPGKVYVVEYGNVYVVEFRNIDEFYGRILGNSATLSNSEVSPNAL